MVEGPGEDAHEGAKTFIEKHGEEYGVEVQAEGAVKVGEIDAWRMQTLGFMQGTRVAADLTFVPFGGLIYRLTVVTPPRSADKYMGRGRASVRSFGPITLKERQAVVVTRLRVVPAVAGESLSELSKRSGNDYGIQETAVLNGLFADARLSEGQLVKIARSQPYVSKPASH